MFRREIPIIGIDGLKKLEKSHVAIFGVGGVGGFVAEILARSGVGELTIVDFDRVSISNINRQIIALNSTVGKLKVDVLEERLLDINPNLVIHKFPIFIDKASLNDISFDFSYVCDAVDNVTAKLLIIEKAKRFNVPVISSMGTGNKINPQLFQIKDINQTKVCPLAKVVRTELRKRGISGVNVLYSEEEPIKSPLFDNGKNVPASISFTPSVAGILIGRYIILDLIK